MQDDCANGEPNGLDIAQELLLMLIMVELKNEDSIRGLCMAVRLVHDPAHLAFQLAASLSDYESAVVQTPLLSSKFRSAFLGFLVHCFTFSPYH